jgi:hypothetical protein
MQEIGVVFLILAALGFLLLLTQFEAFARSSSEITSSLGLLQVNGVTPEATPFAVEATAIMESSALEATAIVQSSQVEATAIVESSAAEAEAIVESGRMAAP